MMNQKIPTGMTEKEYFEVHASQEEFLEWYHQQELPQYEKPSVSGHGSLLLCRRENEALSDSSEGTPFSKLLSASWWFYG